MLPLQGGRDYSALLVDADLCFITQQAGSGNAFFPSKLLGLLAETKPVVTVAGPECELALSLVEGKFGINIPPGHPRELAQLLDSLARDPSRLAEFGSAGRRYVEQFEKGRVLESFAAQLKSLGA
jgi:colanic acid biosynthesis glycosyl transferase WcaI